MVPVDDPVARSIGRELTALENLLTENWSWPSPECGFVLHVFNGTGRSSPIELSELSLGPTIEQRLNEAPILAAAGYLLSQSSPSEEAGLQDRWAEGLARLMTREAFPWDRESFFFRPAELLGVCLGARACSALPAAQLAWLRQVLTSGEARVTRDDLWSRLIGACAARNIGIEWHTPSVPQVVDVSLDELALLTAACGAIERYTRKLWTGSMKKAAYPSG